MKFLWAKRKNDEQHNYDCAFALNLMFEFQTLFTPKNCAKSKLLATSPYTGSSIFYGDVVIFAMRRLSHGKKMSDNKNSHFVWGIHKFLACTIFLGLKKKSKPRNIAQAKTS